MRASLKKARQDAKALELLAKLGHDVSTVEITTSPEDMDRRPENQILQSEAAIQFLRRPLKFISKPCGWCKEIFAADYSSVGYCSWVCRNRAFEELMGVKVDWGAKNLVERWGGEPPLIVDPETLKHLAVLLDQRNQQVLQAQNSSDLLNLLDDLPAFEDESQNTEHSAEVQTTPVPSPQPSKSFYTELVDFLFDHE